MVTLVRPEYLKPGDAVGIVAPARSVTEAEITPFRLLMEKEGYKVVYGQHLFGANGQFSGTINERLADMHRMIMDPEIKAIFAARGGYGTAQLLLELDWNLVYKIPTWMVGFSDVTALHSAMGKYMETIHGMMPYSFAMKEPQNDISFRYLLDVLAGKSVKYEVPDHPLNVSGKVRRELTGGNLSVLYSITGSAFEPDYDRKILFLEDLDEYLYHIDRMILNFELRNIFQRIDGLIVGDFSEMHDNDRGFGKNAMEIIAERAYKYHVPAMFGFPAGHKKNNFPLIFGRFSTLTIQKGKNSLVMY